MSSCIKLIYFLHCMVPGCIQQRKLYLYGLPALAAAASPSHLCLQLSLAKDTASTKHAAPLKHGKYNAARAQHTKTMGL